MCVSDPGEFGSNDGGGFNSREISACFDPAGRTKSISLLFFCVHCGDVRMRPCLAGGKVDDSA